MNENLKVELATFNERLPELLGTDEGKYALVVGSNLVGTFVDYSDAIQAGYKEVGTSVPFLVKKITLVGDAAHFSRPLESARVVYPCPI